MSQQLGLEIAVRASRVMGSAAVAAADPLPGIGWCTALARKPFALIAVRALTIAYAADRLHCR